jgi:hypothetical protein
LVLEKINKIDKPLVNLTKRTIHVKGRVAVLWGGQVKQIKEGEYG